MAADSERIRDIAGRVAASAGLELVEAELRGDGRFRVLRIVIDKPGGVGHDDCAAVSREVAAILDVEDAVPGGPYTLEVSSPGLDRKLTRAEEYERFTGSRVRLRTRQPVEGSRSFEGRLEAFGEGRLTLELAPPQGERRGRAKGRKVAPEPGRRVEIELANVEKANLVPEI